MDTRKKHRRASLHASECEVQQDLQLLYHCSAQHAQSLLRTVPNRSKRRRIVNSRKIEDLDGVLGFASFLAENEDFKRPAKRACRAEVPLAWLVVGLEWSESKCGVMKTESHRACRHVTIATYIQKDLTEGLISSH